MFVQLNAEETAEKFAQVRFAAEDFSRRDRSARLACMRAQEIMLACKLNQGGFLGLSVCCTAGCCSRDAAAERLPSGRSGASDNSVGTRGGGREAFQIQHSNWRPRE